MSIQVQAKTGGTLRVAVARAVGAKALCRLSRDSNEVLRKNWSWGGWCVWLAKLRNADSAGDCDTSNDDNSRKFSFGHSSSHHVDITPSKAPVGF